MGAPSHRLKPAVLIAATVVAMLFAAAVLITCESGAFGGQRLVEVFDNGPVGGPPGASEGYIWVGANENPPPGKSWKATDPDSLTPEQRARIR